MKVFVINLKSSSDRRISIEQQCQMLNLNYEFIEAVDGKDFSRDELSMHTMINSYAIKPGEVGCALSHQKIYDKIVAEEIDHALILEDDALLNPSLSDVLSNLDMGSFKSNPSVILLSKVESYLNKKISIIGEGHILYPIFYAKAAHAYIINNSAAKNLKDLLYPVWMVADHWQLFEDYNAVKVYCIQPELVTLNDCNIISTIQLPENEEKLIDYKNRKKEAWGELKKIRPFSVRLRQRYNRVIKPLLYKRISGK